MKNSLKVGLGILAGGLILAMNRRKLFRKSKKLIYTAPDGIEYYENQIYRTAEGDLFKNGRLMRVQIPVSDNEKNSNVKSVHFENLSKNTQLIPQEVSYHQRGIRHH